MSKTGKMFGVTALLLSVCVSQAAVMSSGKVLRAATLTIEYEYAKDGTLLARSVNGEKQHFKYDKRGQLIEVIDDAGKSLEKYVYDPAGNILSKTVKGKTTTFIYDKANQLAARTDPDGKVTKYEYDSAGRLVKEGNKVYRYSYLDKIVSVEENGKEIASFDYHVDGQIASAVYSGKRETFTWDGLALVSRNETSYLNEPAVTGGNPIASNGKVMLNDMLGSTVGVKDGATLTQTAMTSFGETENSDAFFTGKPYIGELGYAFLFRNYRPDNGKWQTTDPMGYPDGWNQLAYCNNVTTELVDVLGLSSGYYYENDGYYYYSQDANYFIGGSAKTEINNLTDVLAHYRSGAGGTVVAGAGLYSEMKEHSTYESGLIGNDSRVASALKTELLAVPISKNSGTFTRSSFVGALECATLGSYRLNYSSTVNWNASSWVYDSVVANYYRYVTAPVTVTFTGSDDWSFDWNAEYNLWQNITRELIPGWIAGASGTPKSFTITFSTTEIYGLSVKQYE